MLASRLSWYWKYLFHISESMMAPLFFSHPPASSSSGASLPPTASQSPYNPAMSAMPSLGLLGLHLSPLNTSPSLVARGCMLDMFSLLVCFSALHYSRCLWLYSPSYGQWNPYMKSYLGAVIPVLLENSGQQTWQEASWDSSTTSIWYENYLRHLLVTKSLELAGLVARLYLMKAVDFS